MKFLNKNSIIFVILICSFFLYRCDDGGDANIIITGVSVSSSTGGSYYSSYYSYLSFRVKNNGSCEAGSLSVNYTIYDGSCQVASGYESVSSLGNGDMISFKKKLRNIENPDECDRVKFRVSWVEYNEYDGYGHYSDEFEFNL